jgi:hypothetical protein
MTAVVHKFDCGFVSQPLPPELPPAIQQLAESDYPIPADGETPGFENLFNELVGDAATDADGYDTDVSDAILLLDQLDSGLDQLEGLDASAIVFPPPRRPPIGPPVPPFGTGNLDFTFQEILELNPQDALDDLVAMTAAIPDAQSNVNDLGNLLVAATTPAQPGSPGGGPPPPSSNCSNRTNQYGLSTTGAFPGVICGWSLTFQVLRVQDGACTYSAAPAPRQGDTSLPTITSFTLVSGNPAVWQLGHHTAHASDGTPYDVIDVKVTPTQPGHFDGVGHLVLNNGSRTLQACMSVDFIP